MTIIRTPRRTSAATIAALAVGLAAVAGACTSGPPPTTTTTTTTTIVEHTGGPCPTGPIIIDPIECTPLR
ncbi:hypothetical protein [Dermatobacter hominis]|uniref:hypothetical protein n=1 Tax=Dermatobacter hominis TaxID=2884263 RepID=UPI001D10ACAB|nr:hypothetical protein [Dermatobacter hominis]UDY34947.1 hypothetical protein LH044_16610 [Dermatobacter hominis]